MFLKPSGK
jgi:hypothetical protein